MPPSDRDSVGSTSASLCVCLLIASGLAIWRTCAPAVDRSSLQPPQMRLTPGPLSRREKRRRRRRERAAAAVTSALSANSTLGTIRSSAGTLQAKDAPFEIAFYINADDSLQRRNFMEQQLRRSGVQFERWPAIRGGPDLLHTHSSYFKRGVEKHLYLNRTHPNGTIGGWGTIGTYLSHLTLFEHIIQRWQHHDNASFLILQDDTLLKPDWLHQLSAELRLVNPSWSRLLLVWWGLSRKQDCHGHFCVVRPPAGPTEAGPECCGKRFYHGLQAWLVRAHGLRCLVRRLRRRHIKNIDAQMVQCNCPRTYALQKRRMIGSHLQDQLGSERAAVNSVWRAKLQHGDAGVLKKSAQRNLHKTHLQHLVAAAHQPTVANMVSSSP